MKIRNRIVSLLLAMVLFISSIPMNAHAAGDLIYGIGFITGSSVRLRSETNTDSKIIDNAKKGEVVVVEPVAEEPAAEVVVEETEPVAEEADFAE